MRVQVTRDGFVECSADTLHPKECRYIAGLLFTAASEAEEQLEGPYVQVRFLDGGAALYTYRDPSGKCEIGDIVEVPSGYRHVPYLAKVEKFGKGSAVKRAMIIKQVTSILKREVLSC